MEDYNEYKGEDLDMESISLNEVYRKNGIILYEASKVYENDSCPISVIKELFPEYEVSEDKNYFLEKDNVFIHGDNLDELR